MAERLPPSQQSGHGFAPDTEMPRESRTKAMHDQIARQAAEIAQLRLRIAEWEAWARDVSGLDHCVRTTRDAIEAAVEKTGNERRA